MPSSRARAMATLIAALAVLAPFALLVPRAHPQNDDWVAAVTTIQEGGVLAATEWWLRVYSGRYFALVLSHSTPLARGSLEGWRVALAAYMLVLPLGTWALVSALAPRSARALERVAVTAGVVALLHGWMPSPAAGLYWMTGAVCYGVGEGILLASFACAVRAERAGARLPWTWAAAAAGLAALAAGTNEALALLLVGTFSVALAHAVARRRPAARIAMLLAVSAAALAVVLLMPGTQFRMEAQRPEGGRQLLPLVGQALAISWRSALRWGATTPLVPGAFLLGLLAAGARAKDGAWSFPPPAIVVPAAAAAYLGTTLAPVVGQGEIPRHTLNLVHAVFSVGVLASAVSLGAALAARRRAPAAPAWLGPAAAVAVAVLALLPGSSLRSAWVDLATGRAARHDAAMVARYRLLERCGPVCEVPRALDPPSTLVWFEDAADESSDSPFFLAYKDGALALFFGKSRVRLAAAAGGAPAGGAP